MPLSDPEPQRRRRRPAMSCKLCRDRKIRCNRQQPCSNCIRSRNQDCYYENPPVQIQPARAPDQDASSISTTATATSKAHSDLNTSTESTHSLKSRISSLESQLAKVTTSSARTEPHIPVQAASAVTRLETAEPRIGGGTVYIHHGDPTLGQSPCMHRSLTHKGRMYGQSHWMNMSLVLVKDIAQLVGAQVRDPNHKELAEKVFGDMHKCKRMARIIKMQREPPWPCVTTTELPPKQTADDLVDAYFRTYEAIYRIIHIPTFKRHYELLWVSESEPDASFLIQLKLVMALGAVSYDDHFTLRPTALRWIYEAETWLSAPMLKHRLNLQYIQIYCLQILAREALAVGEKLISISAGALLRSAFILGLHRDPINLPSKSNFANEMHRRLWSTVLELCLQASINSGFPPFLSLDDFDTQPASNLDDDQLENEDAVPKPLNDFTQASISITLRNIFPARLAITRFLNNFSSSGTFEETVRLDSELKECYHALRNILRPSASRTSSGPSEIQLRMVDTIIQRYVCVLHAPFFVASVDDNKYAYSRKACVDSAMKIWYATRPTLDCSFHAMPSSADEFQRIVTCGKGFFRSSALQSLFMIFIELKLQIRDNKGLSFTPLRRDLLAVLEGAPRWSLWCIEAGGTNIKGHVFTRLTLALIQGLSEGLEVADLGKSIIEAAKIAEDEGMVLLEKMTRRGTTTQIPSDMAGMSVDQAPAMPPDWELSQMMDGISDEYGFDLMSWSFDQMDPQSSWFF